MEVPAIIKASLAGAVLVEQPGTVGLGGGLVPSFLLQELIMNTDNTKRVVPALSFMCS
jgi:hypothetical protein